MLTAMRPRASASPGSGVPTSSPGETDVWGGLMAAAQDGNGGAYRRLLGEVSPWLTRYFGRRLPPSKVDDALQETLLAVHRRRHTYDPRQPFGPWLSAIAKRKWIDQLRSLERLAEVDLPDDLAVGDHESAVTSASVLASLIGHLKPAQAQVLLLVKLQGYSIEEASRETGQSIPAVKVNVHRGLARLTTLIAKNDDVE
jgi:RNA polymerase sigma-70 factor (ECF subfamily)